MKSYISYIVIVAAIMAAPAKADFENLRTRISTVITSESNAGGCYVYMVASHSLAGCNARYATFDCLGTSGQISKSSANINWQAAQLAFVAEKDILIYIDNTVVLNGMCLARATSVIN